MKLWRRKNWFERLTSEQQERFKWEVICVNERLGDPVALSTAEIKARFEEKLYPLKGVK